MSTPIVAGIDEVGRGALAGPVVAAACVLVHPLTKLRTSPPRWKLRYARDDAFLIADSKLLSPAARESAYAWIIESCPFGIGSCSAEDIDRHGILWATNRAMTLALEELCQRCDVHSLLVDGRDRFAFPLPHRSIIRGDQTEPAIAAASIVAKVTRDRLLTQTEALFPAFGFSVHKGYGTPRHAKELRKHGPTEFHRQTFIRSVLTSGAVRAEAK